MAKKKKTKGRKVRVAFKQNRNKPQRRQDWTRRYQDSTDAVVDHVTTESVRAKGELSRKRTIIVDDEAAFGGKPGQARGVVVSSHGLVSRVDDDSGQTWDCTVRRVLKTRLIQQRGSVTVGDRVWFAPVSQAEDQSERTGVIEQVEPRSTRLSRRDGRGREHTIVANADQLLIVGSLFEPTVKPHLIDRYIVAALRGELRPVIVLNKLDLYAGEDSIEDGDDAGDALTVEHLVNEFRSLGYVCIATSALRGDGLDELRDALKGHMTVLSGQSGVGKSTLINALQPGLKLSTATVSNANEKGRHTTTYARLLRLDFDGYVVDTPGIRSFDLWDIAPPDLEKYFVEFQPYLDHCRYRDCLHTDETGCAVAAAAEAEAISERRYYSYVKMYQDAGR